MEVHSDKDPLDIIRETGMRVVRVLSDGDCRYGLADNSTITLITEEPFAAWETEGTIDLGHTELLSPVVPTKIVCVGLNYRGHARELGCEIPDEPLLFLKPPTAINHPGHAIDMPDGVGRVDYEAELAAVIGRRTHKASAAEAAENILGFTCANDITARDVQRQDGQWTRAKSYDGFCPLGPWVDTDIDPTGLAIESRVNGEVRQSANTSDMIFSVFDLVSFVSNVMTLVPGDVVLTGTPSGIGALTHGDLVEIEIEGIGTLSNTVS